MRGDTIILIDIDILGRLRIFPEKEKFTLIWRSATEVHWDKEGFLYSPQPREWSYFDWFKYIVTTINSETSIKLLITKKTCFHNITDSLRQQILEFDQ
jgi:hypothetical protein